MKPSSLKLLRQYMATALKIPYAFALALYLLILMIFYGETYEEESL